MTRIMTIVGTRPEIIRLAATIRRLDKMVDHILVHTGQNYDYELNQVFFEELGLRAPDHYLDVDTSSLGTVLGGVLSGTERILEEVRPDALLVLGDTNSCISALMAARRGIPVYHMEAGNRSYDNNVPEETNRRMVDHVSDYNLAYTEHARRNLLSEGKHPRQVIVTGSPMCEVLAHQREAIDASRALERLGLSKDGYFLVSAHREENVDSPERLHRLLDVLEAVRDEFELPILVSTHPRTRNRMESLGREVRGVTWHKPLGFNDYNRLQMAARCVLSDSGTIAEESTMLGFPAVTLRDSIERPEAVDTGSIIMTGLDPANAIEAITLAVATAPPSVPADYAIENTSERVVKYIISTYRRHGQWTGRRPDAPSIPALAEAKTS